MAIAPVLSVGQDPPVLLARVAQRIRIAREASGLSQEALGELAGGLNKETINRIELGGNTTLETMRKIADALQLPVDLFFSEEESDLLRQTRTGVPTVEAERDDADVRRGYVPDSIPVIAEGEATPSGMQWTNTVTRHVVIEYMDRPDGVDDPDAYGLMVIGDSMQPMLYRGYRVIASPRTPIDDGTTVYVQLVTGERLIKVAYREEGGWRLESLNRQYEPKRVTDDAIEAIHRIVSVNLTKPGRRVIDEQTGKRLRG